MKEGISVFSTHATDILLNEKGEILSQQPGGPIIFIEDVLRKSGVPFNSYHGDTVNVEILITPDGEFGRVPKAPQSLVIPFSEIDDLIIISTLLSDWDFSQIETFHGKAFVDIQGFVRDGGDFGNKRVWKESKNFTGWASTP